MDVETVALPTVAVLWALREGWGFVRWLAARKVKEDDETAARLAAVEKALMELNQASQHRSVLVERIDGKLDAYSHRLADHDRQLIELQVRLRHVEAERHRTAQHLDDLSRFLSAHGFTKRKVTDAE